MFGVDVSNWQGRTGLNLDKINTDFVIAKATEGKCTEPGAVHGWYVDRYCDGFVSWAKKNKKPFGFYHFARPENDAIEEARFFYKHTSNYFGEGIPILDWEDTRYISNVAWAKTWLDEVYRLSGVKPMIYMSESVENNHDWSSVVKGDYGLWLAKYKNQLPLRNYNINGAGRKPNPLHWEFMAMWQFTGTGRLDGYAGDIDCDIFYGDVDTWNAYANKKNENIVEKEVAPEASKDEVDKDAVISSLQAELERLKKERTIAYTKINEAHNSLKKAYECLGKLLDEVE